MTLDPLHITSWDIHGRGVATYSQQGNTVKIVVPGSIVGETVTTTPPTKTPSGREASILEIPLPSPFRIEPQCPHFTVCGGCAWQHLKYEEQLRIKQEWIENLFLPICHDKSLIHPILASLESWHYRNKMEFSFSQDKAGHRFLGLYKYRSRVIDVLSCPISPSWMAETLSCVRAWWEESHLMAYFSKNDSGTLQTITFREGVTTGDRMVILTLSGNPAFAPKKKHLETFVETVRQTAQPPQGHLSIIARIKQIGKKRPTQFFEMVLFGPDYFREHLFVPLIKKELEFQISPQAFFQPNTKQALTIYSQVLQMLDLTSADIVWDLYCGIGIFGMFSALLAQSSVGIELSRESAYDATTNAKRLGLSNFSIHCGDVATVVSSMKKEGSFKEPTAIIVDPPRVGLSEKALEEIQTLRAQKLIYVSCNPHSQNRDVRLLLQEGWKIKAIQPIDQFPHTPHLENIIHLER
jgi:23S rRNA (uracil1939-C5)-methyltransferase